MNPHTQMEVVLAAVLNHVLKDNKPESHRTLQSEIQTVRVTASNTGLQLKTLLFLGKNITNRLATYDSTSI